MHHDHSMTLHESASTLRRHYPTPVVGRAKALLSANPTAPHRINDIAKTLAVSPFHLSHVFRAQTGTSIHQYLLRLRMELAIARLRDGELSLSRLALDLGFSSHSHFTAVFGKHFGARPAEVRARIRDDASSSPRDSGAQRCSAGRGFAGLTPIASSPPALP